MAGRLWPLFSLAVVNTIYITDEIEEAVTIEVQPARLTWQIKQAATTEALLGTHLA